MSFERNWDDSCPREWDRWDQDGTTYVIQDLPPEDDEKALNILVEIMFSEEVLYSLSDISNDPTSVEEVTKGMLKTIKKRISLACYAEKDGHRKLVALNVCTPQEKVKEKYEAKPSIIGKKFRNVRDAALYAEDKAKSLETLGLDLALTSFGLVVVKDYRGKQLGYKVLAAREAMCRSLGIKGTTTLFTSVAAQKSAEKAGFKSIFEMPIREFAKIGLDYPEDDERLVKVMVKKFE